jgi:agmatine deiminase
VSARRTAAASPRSLGYRMPPEWAPHAGTWVAWPHRRDDWPGRFEAIPFVFAEIVRHLVVHEPVRIIVRSVHHEATAHALLDANGVPSDHVRFFRWPTDRAWVRDSGPIFVRRDAGTEAPPPVGVTDWQFNAWAKYEDWRRDDRLPSRVARELGLPLWRPRLAGRRVVLEGGAIDVNGAGLLLATEECLLGDVQARNPGVDRPAMERVLYDYLGVDRVLWLARGIVGDDTHGHVDDVARFTDEATVVAAVEPNPDDPNHAILEENLERLRAATTPDGNPLTVVELPMPRPIAYSGQRVPASYLNFYIANGVVLVPTFNDPADRAALATLGRLFPGREVTGIHCGDLVWGLGTIHCLTQQEPAPMPVSAGPTAAPVG